MPNYNLTEKQKDRAKLFLDKGWTLEAKIEENTSLDILISPKGNVFFYDKLWIGGYEIIEPGKDYSDVEDDEWCDIFDSEEMVQALKEAYDLLDAIGEFYSPLTKPNFSSRI